MTAKPRLAFTLLALCAVVVSFYLVHVQPDPLVVTEAFPAGLLAGAWLFVPRRARVLFFAGVVVVVTAQYLVHDRPWAVALGWALAAAVGSAYVGHGVGQGRRRRAVLLTEDDLRRFVSHSFVGAVLAAAVAGVVAAATDHVQVWIAVGGVGLAHFATYMVLLPHFMGRPRFPGVSSLTERTIQWVCTVTFTVFAFLPFELGPGVLFCIIPFLGWSALRAPMRETLVQLLVVATIAHTMTVRGLGPFAVDASMSLVRAELTTMALALFIAACALTTIPFSLAVGVQRRESWLARQEQARVRQLVSSAAVAIIGTDARGHIDLFNPGAQELFGYSADEVRGLSPSILLTSAEVIRLAGVLSTRPSFVDVAQELANGRSESLDVEFLRKDGTTLTLQFSVSSIRRADGKVVGYVSTAEDVTDRVQRELALEEALAHERVAVENLKEIDQVKDALVSGVSHELRTPITSILGYLEVLEEGGFGPLESDQLRALSRVKGNSRRLLALIDDLLVLSQIQEGLLAVDAGRLDLRDVVSGALEQVSGPLADCGLELTATIPEKPVNVIGDAERLTRVVGNLLDNAVKFTDAPGRVRVSLVIEAGDAVLSVSDSGIGIPPEEVNGLFERFFRANSARERAIQGSGLGLSIASALVNSHGGTIEVDSAVDEGTTFTIRLPLESSLAVVEQGGVPLAELTFPGEQARMRCSAVPDSNG